MNRFLIFVLSGILTTGQLLSQAVVISADTYQYHYPAEYDQSISIDEIVIKDTTNKIHFDASNPVTIKLSFNGYYDDPSVLTFSSNDQADTLVDQGTVSISGNQLSFSLTDTLDNNREIRIHGVSFRGGGTASVGRVQLVSGTEVIGESAQKIVFGDVSLSMEEKVFFATNADKDTLEITLTEAAEPILYPGRKIYLRFNKDLNWKVDYSDFGKISASSATGKILTLTVDEELTAGESVSLELPVQPSSDNVYDIQVEASYINSSTGFYDITSSKFHFASAEVELANSLSYVVGDSRLVLPGLQLINDTKVDIFRAGTNFSIEIPAEINLIWDFVDVIDNSGFNFSVNSSNNRVLDVSCSIDHTAGQTYEIDNLIVTAGNTVSSGSISINFENSEYSVRTDNTVQIYKPTVTLENADIFISSDESARSLSKITISNTSPSVIDADRQLSVILPVGFEWDADNLPTFSSGLGSVTFNADNPRQINISITGRVDGSGELSNGKIKSAEDSYKTGNIIVQWNNNITQFASDSEIQLIKPISVTFSESSWIISDQSQSLGTFELDFYGKPFSEDYYLFLKIPDEASSVFITPSSIPDWATNVNLISNSRVLQFALKNSSASSVSWNDGIQINASSGAESFKLQLALLKKEEYSVFDDQNWESTTEIYIKKPVHNIEYNSVLLCQKGAQSLANISISQTTAAGQSLFRPGRKVTLQLPIGLSWITDGLIHANAERTSGTDPNILQLSFTNETDKLVISGIRVDTDNFSPVNPQKIKITYNNNSTAFYTDKTLRAGIFNNVQQADTSFIIGDSASVLPKAIITQTESSPPLLIPGYSLVLKSNDNIDFEASQAPAINISDKLSYARDYSKQLSFQPDQSVEISEEISIANLVISNFNESDENQLIWIFRNDNTGELVPMDTVKVFVGDIIFQYVDANNSEFRYPVYILNDDNVRKFPAVKILADKGKHLLRKNRKFMFRLPEGITWNNPTYLQYFIDEDQTVDSLVYDGLYVSGFSRELESEELKVFISNNERSRSVAGQSIKVADPAIKISDTDQTTQTFWLNEGIAKEAKWFLKKFVLSKAKSSGYVPEFGLRLRIINTGELEFIDGAPEIYYGTLLLADAIATGEIVVNDETGQTWNDNDIVFNKVKVNVKNTFESVQIEFCLTDEPYYWQKCSFNLYANDPVIDIPKTAFLAGDSGTAFPDISLRDFNYLPVDNDGNPSLDIMLPDGFPAVWQGEDSGIIFRKFDRENIGNSWTINDLLIDKVPERTIFSPAPLMIRSAEYQLAVDTAAAFRYTSNTVKVGNPEVYIAAVGPGNRSKYRFCVKDPDFMIDTIKIAEDSVPALLEGDTIYIKIEQDDFRANFIDADINLSSEMELIDIEEKLIRLKVTGDFTGNSIYSISGIQIGEFTDNVQKDYLLKVYLRNPADLTHPIRDIAVLQIGKPVIEFIDASKDSLYYISTDQKKFSLNTIVSIKDDPLYPVIDTEGLLLKLDNIDADSSIEWDPDYDNHAIWFQGSGIRKLAGNKIEISRDSVIIAIDDTLNANDVLRFKPFNFVLHKDGIVRISVSNNRGASYLSACKIYYSNPECRFTSGEQKILKFRKQDNLDDLILSSVYGLNSYLWVNIPKNLNCWWDSSNVADISITDKNGKEIHNGAATQIIYSDEGKGNLIQLGLNGVSEDVKNTLTISHLPLEFNQNDPSSSDSLLIFWDSPSYRKLSVKCQNRITIGCPSIDLSANVYLYSQDFGKQYNLPDIKIQDDSVTQFITGSESVSVKIPESLNSSISFIIAEELGLRIEDDTINVNVLNWSDSLLTFQLPDSGTLNKYHNKTMYLFGLVCTVKMSEQSPASFKYYFKDFPFPDSMKIQIANPSFELAGNHHFVMDAKGNINLENTIFFIKEGTVPGLRNGSNIEIEIWPNNMNEAGFCWKGCQKSQDFAISEMKKERIYVRIDRDFQKNDSTGFSDIQWAVHLDSLLDYSDLFSLFPESISVRVNFRPDEPRQPAWYELRDKINIHLPVFYTEPQFSGNRLEFSAIKGFLNNESDEWSKGINFNTSCSDPLFLRSKFIPDSLGIRYQVQKQAVDNFDEFTIILDDSAVFEMNRMFQEYLYSATTDTQKKELWLGLDFPAVGLSGEKSADYFDWYKSEVRFTGYCPYDSEMVHESDLCFNQDNPFHLELSLDTNYTFFADMVDLYTGDTIINSNISNGGKYTFTDTSGQYFKNEGLYLFKVSGFSVGDSSEIFPYYRYLLYDTTKPNLDRTSVQPRIVERHAARSRFSYSGLTMSIFDTLKFVIYDNVKTDSSGFQIYPDSISNAIPIPYSFGTEEQVRIQTVFRDTSDGILSQTNQYCLASKIDESFTFRLVDEKDQVLWFPVDTLVPEEMEGNLAIIVTVEDASGNQSKDTLSYYLILAEGENDLLSQFIFNYPNPFSVYEGTTFRYVVTEDNLNRGKLVVIDGGGDIVYLKKLTSDLLTPGIHHEFKWDGRSIYGEKLASGVYFGYFEVENNAKKKVSHLKIAIDNR